MKNPGSLIYFFSFALLNFQPISSSDLPELNKQSINQIMNKMDEKTAQQILDRYHSYQKKMNTQDATNLDGLFDQFESKITPLSQKAIAQHNKQQRNKLLSRSFGAAAIYASLNSQKIIDGLLNAQPKRVFIIDDLIAAGAAKSVWNTIVPSLVTGITCFFAWRQVDYYLHAEERSRFAILEHELHTDFNGIRAEVKKQFAARDKDFLGRQKAIYQYIDKQFNAAHEQIEHEIKTLSAHCEREDLHLKELFKSLSQDHDNRNEITTKLISHVHESIENTGEEIAGVLEKIKEMQKNNHKMQSKLKEMSPMMIRILQGIDTHNANPHNSHDELLSITIPSEDELEHKSQTTPASAGRSIKSQFLKMAAPFTSNSKNIKNTKTTNQPVMTSSTAAKINTTINADEKQASIAQASQALALSQAAKAKK